MNKTALIIIDMQNDFINPKGSLYVKDADSLVEHTVSLMQEPKWDCVAMTKDWHPSDHVSFAKNHNLPEFSPITYTLPVEGQEHKTYESQLWPDHCIQGTWGAEFHPDLIKAFESLKVPHRVIEKGYLTDDEYYSGFSDIWGQHVTELNVYLNENKITNLFIVGMTFDFCVKATAIDAIKLGYDVTILKKYTKSIADENKVLDIERMLVENDVKLI